MRKFWGFYDNGTYRVGCNGATVYVYDSQDNEVAKFKDFPYAYKGMFMPGRNIIVIKSTEGYLGFYDLDALELMQKIVITRIGAQDEGFSFTLDGRFFYNIEKPQFSTATQLAIYETETFTKVNTLFSDRKELVLCHIEFDNESEKCYTLGFMRDETGVFDFGFIGLLNVEGADICEIKRMERSQYNYVNGYKNWELRGFTEKSLEWNYDLRNLEKIEPVSLKSTYWSM